MTGSSSGARSLTAVGLIVAAALLLSGCVYLRLLQVKRQIGAFDRNFVVHTDEGVQIVCRDPVLLTDDIRWFGLGPEQSRKAGSAEFWQVRWVKQLPPEIKEHGAYDIVVELRFTNEKLSRVIIPERYFKVMPKSLLVDLLRSLGGAKIDRGDRSLEALVAGARPDLPGIGTLLGKPSSNSREGSETVMRYQYVPKTNEGLARSAVFDMTIRFNAAGDMIRWDGQTPVGKIGFKFR